MPEPLKPPGKKAAAKPPRRPRTAVPPVELDAEGRPKLTLESMRSEQHQIEYVEKEATPAQAFDPAYEAHLLRVAGKGWDEIAAETGYPGPLQAAQAVSRYLQKAVASQSAMHMQEMLQTQVARYETILSSWWSLATTGHDDKAALVVLRALERIDRLHRLTDGEVTVTKETLVISADPEEYVRQLRELTDGASN